MFCCCDENKLVLAQYAQKVEELKIIQQKLHMNSMQHHEQLFNDLQSYGRAAGQVASSVILLVDQTKDKSSSSSKIKLSGRIAKSVSLDRERSLFIGTL